MSKANKEIVRAALDRLAEGDLAGVTAMIAQDGPAFAAALEERLVPFAAHEIKTGQFVARDDVVIVEVRLVGRSATGEKLKQRHAQVWQIRDGGVVRVQLYATIEQAIVRAGYGAPPPPPPRSGSLGHSERFGRFESEGDLDAELDLPAGEVRVSVVNFASTDGLEVDLVGPAGPVALRRLPETAPSHDSRYSLHPIVTGEVTTPGRHRVRVRGFPTPDARTIAIGRDPFPTALVLGAPGRLGRR